MVFFRRGVVLGSLTIILWGGIFWGSAVFAAESTANLDKALRSGKKVINFSGKESDNVKIRKGVTVIGTNPEKAVINGDVIMEDGSTLQNVTVNGNIIPITIEKGASATLINVSIRGGSDAGIYAPKGGGTLTVKNSRIAKNRKGIFILTGKSVILTGNTISGNREEGADFHSAIGGSISGNVFSDNGEGGMEMIINGSTLTISGNTFANNKASGLALQSYSGGKLTGNISVEKNVFTGNGNYGMDCKNPQGSGNGAHFRASATAVGNILKLNKLGPISPRCFFANQAEIPKEDIATEEVETEESLEMDITEEIQEENITEEMSQNVEEMREEDESLLEENVEDVQESLHVVYKSFLSRSPISFLFPFSWRETFDGFLSNVRW
ncbi:MAG: right-handed parallel beta-helix repeat-containing protein [Patescibacteria group bacterium]